MSNKCHLALLKGDPKNKLKKMNLVFPKLEHELNTEV